MKLQYFFLLIISIIFIDCSQQKSAPVDIEKIKEEAFTDGKQRGYELFQKDLEERSRAEYIRGYSEGFNKALKISKVSNHIIFKELIKNQIYFLKYYQNYFSDDKSKNHTLVSGWIDTVYCFEHEVKRGSGIKKMDDKICSLTRNLYEQNGHIRNSPFYFDKILKISDDLKIGQFIDYLGHEFIGYTFCRIDTLETYYVLSKFYHRLGGTSIGRISHVKIINLGDGEFAFVDRVSGEEHDGFSVHYFGNNMQNVQKEIVKYNPGLEISVKKLEYSFSENDSVLTAQIYKRTDDVYANTPEEKWNWKIESEKVFNIYEIINELKNSMNIGKE